jgi:carboxyl-terminal processing protease
MTRAMSRVVLGGWLLAFVAAWSAIVPQPARAEENRTPQPYVVLVGISNYADKQIPPRPHAEADTQALYDLFTNKDYLGVDAEHTRLLLGTPDEKRHSQPATRENIIKALHWVSTNAKQNDLVIFAFIGQGAGLSDQGDRLCYFATDSTFAERKKNAVAAADIAQELDKLQSHKFCTLMDVSFKSVGGKDPFSDANPDNSPYKEFLGSEGKEEHTAAPGRAVFLATLGRTQSVDLADHGLFTKIVIDGLKGAADKEGYEPDGVVTVDELTEYIDKELPVLAHKNGKTKDEKDQLPLVLGSRNSHFVITKNPAVTAKVQSQVDKINDLVKQNKLSKELGDEAVKLLSQMPKLEAQRSLRKEYQQLVGGAKTVEDFTAKRESILDATKLKRSDALTYARKVMEGTKLIRDNYVKEVNLGNMIDWAVRGLYRRVEAKVPEDIGERLAKAKDLKEADLTVLLADARESLGKREDLDNHKDIDFSLQRMTSHLDPYTTFIDAETKQKFDTDTQGFFTGIGIQIRKDVERDMLRVITPIKDSPAYKAGILEGDIITHIIREVDSFGKPLDPPETITTKGMALNDAVKKIMGQPRTKVKVTVDRDGKAMDFEMNRSRIELESVLGIKRKSNDDWDFWVDPANKIAYVRLTSFARNTYRDLLKAMREVGADKGEVKGMILDLRFNPGGLLDSAVNITDLYIDDGLIVKIKPRVGREASFTGRSDGSLLDFPMVCLVNGGSASGSEIVSAALQDHHRALVMGERSYGKGSVQNIQPFEGGEIKLTTASFWRPSGKNLNKSSTGGRDEDEWGVTPDKGFGLKLSRKERDDLFEHQRDIEIIHRHDKEGDKEVKDFKDRQLDMAVEYLRSQINTASRGSSKKAG